MGHPFSGSGHAREPIRVLALDIPYLVIRAFCTAYLMHGGAAEEALRDPGVAPQGGAHRRALRLLAEALGEEERRQEAAGSATATPRRGGGGAGSGGSGGGSGVGSVLVYSSMEDCFDVVPLLGGRARRGLVGAGGGGGGGDGERGGGGGGGGRKGGEKR